MSEGREQILAAIQGSLKRGRLDAEREADLKARVTAHRRNLVPERATVLDHRARIDLFVALAEEVQATVTRVNSLDEVPGRLRVISPTKTCRPNSCSHPTRSWTGYLGMFAHC